MRASTARVVGTRIMGNASGYTTIPGYFEVYPDTVPAGPRRAACTRPAMAPSCRLLLLGLVSFAGVEAKAKKDVCTSSLAGDYAYKACGAFCKPEKSTNHCKVCHQGSP